MSPTYSVCADHGYIAGEHWTCPECGKKAEVYSRITGYYRPVQNWNDGKLAEFKERKTYDIANSVMHRDEDECALCQINFDAEGDNTEQDVKNEEILIFTTKTCPNCKMAKMMLDKAGIKYTAIDAEDNKDMTVGYGIKKAPTMLVPNGNGFDVYDNASKIKGYIESIK
jgi:ribonucleoside-triphosphate reductase